MSISPYSLVSPHSVHNRQWKPYGSLLSEATSWKRQLHGFHSSTGIQIEQSTNQPKLFTNPEIQPKACIVTERSKNCLPAFEYPEAAQPSSVAVMLCSCGNSTPHSTLPLKLLRNWAYPNLSCSVGHILLHSCSLFVYHHTPSGFHDNKNKIISS